MEKLKFKQSLFLVAFGIVLYLLLQNISSVWGLLRSLQIVVLPLTYGFVIAYILNIPFKWYQDKVFGFMKRKGGLAAKMSIHISLILSYVTVLLILAFLIWIIIPQLFTSITLLVQNIPYYVESTESFINKLVDDLDLEQFYSGRLTGSWASVLEFYSRQAQTILPDVVAHVMNVTSTVFNVFIGIAFSVYLLYSKDKLIKQMKRFMWAYGPRKHNHRILELSARTNYLFTRFIAGNLLDAIVVGILCFLGMTVFRFPYPLLVSVIIGVTNLIPIVGPFIGAVPGALIILTVDPTKALLFLLFVLALQQIDGNIIKPRLFGNQVGLPSLWVLLAIVVGGRLFGIVGMLIGVPVFALIYSVLRESIERRLEKRAIPLDPKTEVPVEALAPDETAAASPDELPGDGIAGKKSGIGLFRHRRNKHMNDNEETPADHNDEHD